MAGKKGPSSSKKSMPSGKHMMPGGKMMSKAEMDKMMKGKK